MLNGFLSALRLIGTAAHSGGANMRVLFHERPHFNPHNGGWDSAIRSLSALAVNLYVMGTKPRREPLLGAN
jgi:hypothetical protein